MNIILVFFVVIHFWDYIILSRDSPGSLHYVITTFLFYALVLSSVSLSYYHVVSIMISHCMLSFFWNYIILSRHSPSSFDYVITTVPFRSPVLSSVSLPYYRVISIMISRCMLSLFFLHCPLSLLSYTVLRCCDFI
jgi:hypothetical protein